jgi:hypothetical protein
MNQHDTLQTVSFTETFGRGQNYAKGADSFGDYEVIGYRPKPEHVRRIAQACSEYHKELPKWGDARATSLLKLLSAKYKIKYQKIVKILNIKINESNKSKKKRKSRAKSKTIRRKATAA